MDYGNIMLTNMPRTGSPIIGNPYVYDRVAKLDNVSSISFHMHFIVLSTSLNGIE